MITWNFLSGGRSLEPWWSRKRCGCWNSEAQVCYSLFLFHELKNFFFPIIIIIIIIVIIIIFFFRYELQLEAEKAGTAPAMDMSELMGTKYLFTK